MNWEKVYSIENVVTTSYDSFDKALSLGLIVFYNHKSQLQVLCADLLKSVCDNLDQGSSYYEVFGNSISFKFGNTIKRLNLGICSFEFVCKTDEESISFLNLDYCLGSTSKRNPRIRRNELISTKDNSVVYKWEDDKNLVICENEMFLFQTKFRGNLYLMDINEDVKVWDIIIDNGIPGRRYYQKIVNNQLLVQKYFPVDNNNLIKIDMFNGAILWEIENTLSFYNYDASRCKLYGLGAKTLEVINVDTGEREIQEELSDNLHIAPHLTYYDGGVLYFSGYRDNNIPVFGGVNVEDGKIVFTQEVDMPGNRSFRKGLDRPIVTDNRLYVRDTLKTLHIYEK